MASPRHGDPRFYALLEEIAELHSRKNHDYAKTEEPLSNFKRAEAFGIEPWKGILVRMSDKWSRIEELSKGKTPKNESLRDSLVDNAVYSLLAVLLLEDSTNAADGGVAPAGSSMRDVSVLAMPHLAAGVADY